MLNASTLSYQVYLGLSEIQTTLRFLPAGIMGGMSFPLQDIRFINLELNSNLKSIVVVSFAIPYAVSRISSFYILLFGLSCGLISPLLFAFPIIPTSTSYWAYGFPAMVLCMSIEIIWPVVGLQISKRLPQEDQALGAGMLQTVQNVGRALGLAIATAVQTAAQNRTGQLDGLRAGQWVSVGFVGLDIVITVVYFRDIGKF